MNFEFALHTEEQMLIRSISKTNVLEIVHNPDQIVADNNDDSIKVYQSIIKENSQMFLLRVFVNIYKNPKLIVTLYKTTKISKYYES
jgi:hypothetical protein